MLAINNTSGLCEVAVVALHWFEFCYGEAGYRKTCLAALLLCETSLVFRETIYSIKRGARVTSPY